MKGNMKNRGKNIPKYNTSRNSDLNAQMTTDAGQRNKVNFHSEFINETVGKLDSTV